MQNLTHGACLRTSSTSSTSFRGSKKLKNGSNDHFGLFGLRKTNVSTEKVNKKVNTSVFARTKCLKNLTLFMIPYCILHLNCPWTLGGPLCMFFRNCKTISSKRFWRNKELQQPRRNFHRLDCFKTLILKRTSLGDPCDPQVQPDLRPARRAVTPKLLGKSKTVATRYVYREVCYKQTCGKYEKLMRTNINESDSRSFPTLNSILCFTLPTLG